MTCRYMNKLFSTRLRERRKKLGLTVQTLADTCETSRSYITLIETGRRMPAKKILPRIALALGLKTVVVLNWYLDDMRMKFTSTEEME